MSQIKTREAYVEVEDGFRVWTKSIGGGTADDYPALLILHGGPGGGHAAVGRGGGGLDGHAARSLAARPRHGTPPTQKARSPTPVRVTAWARCPA
mgnify:CR=1 FL=1